MTQVLPQGQDKALLVEALLVLWGVISEDSVRVVLRRKSNFWPAKQWELDVIGLVIRDGVAEIASRRPLLTKTRLVSTLTQWKNITPRRIAGELVSGTEITRIVASHAGYLIVSDDECFLASSKPRTKIVNGKGILQGDMDVEQLRLPPMTLQTAEVLADIIAASPKGSAWIRRGVILSDDGDIAPQDSHRPGWLERDYPLLRGIATPAVCPLYYSTNKFPAAVGACGINIRFAD